MFPLFPKEEAEAQTGAVRGLRHAEPTCCALTDPAFLGSVLRDPSCGTPHQRCCWGAGCHGGLHTGASVLPGPSLSPHTAPPPVPALPPHSPGLGHTPLPINGVAEPGRMLDACWLLASLPSSLPFLPKATPSRGIGDHSLGWRKGGLWLSGR